MLKEKAYNIANYLRNWKLLDDLYLWGITIKHRTMIMRFKAISIKQYCKRENNRYTVIEEEKERTVFEPEYFNFSNASEYHFTSPEIYVAELENVEVHGGTGLMISSDEVITDLCENDVDDRLKYPEGLIQRGNRKQLWLEVSKTYIEIDTAINLCGLASYNYYHLTIEILSRYGYIQKLCSNSIPVLLDEDAKKHKQYVDMIHVLIGESEIIYVPRATRVRCKKVFYPSMNTWMPMNVKKRDMFRLSDNMIATSGIDFIRKRTERYRESYINRKIFISRRKTRLSRISNEEAVAKLFAAAGYEIVYVEDYSYIEQIELFSSASHIIGATGAAFTNLVYCNPGTVVGCIIPSEYNFCIYSTIAGIVGCKAVFFNGVVEKKRCSVSEELYHINLKECQQYIEWI